MEAARADHDARRAAAWAFDDQRSSSSADAEARRPIASAIAGTSSGVTIPADGVVHHARLLHAVGDQQRAPIGEVVEQLDRQRQVVVGAAGPRDHRGEHVRQQGCDRRPLGAHDPHPLGMRRRGLLTGPADDGELDVRAMLARQAERPRSDDRRPAPADGRRRRRGGCVRPGFAPPRPGPASRAAGGWQWSRRGRRPVPGLTTGRRDAVDTAPSARTAGRKARAPIQRRRVSGR